MATAANRPAPRNLVVCCDGTSNEFAADRTNVAKPTYAPVCRQPFGHDRPGKPGTNDHEVVGGPLGERAQRWCPRFGLISRKPGAAGEPVGHDHLAAR